MSNDTIKELIIRRKQALERGDRRPLQRITALLLLPKLEAVDEVACLLAVGTSTVYGWLKDFMPHSFASLRYQRSPGRPSKLTPTQKQRLVELLDAGPEAAGFATGCWNAALVQTLIAQEFGKLYNLHYISELLANLGFSYQRARFVSDQLDNERRTQWLHEQWPQILRQAQAAGALLLFADEASFAQWGSLGYSWSRRGVQPLVKTSGKRKGYKVFGLLDYFSGRLFWRGCEERFTAASYCEFVRDVLEQTTQPLYIIQDGARYHTAKATQEFIARHSARVRVFQLPSYSPDYNPIEHLWRNVKRQKTHNRYFASFSALCAAVAAALKHYQEHSKEVRQLMGTILDQMAAPCHQAA
ncbi:MAG: IS630 family transposase [Phormidesmis sp.]